MNKVIVTGASGFIGGQTVIQFAEAGWHVIGIDCNHPPKAITEHTKKFLVSDFCSSEALELIAKTNADAIVHCAGTSLVGPSMKDPAPYYDNNVTCTKKMLDTIVEHKLQTRIIFSSSASVYGEPVIVPISEEDPKEPLSPYGESKRMVEMMLNSYNRAYGLNYIAFRYFNVCGADPHARHGQKNGATHIIARILEAIHQNKDFNLNGVDYPTKDGTCIRDYVHVSDIARAHLLAAQHGEAGIYNLATGTGNSNREIIETAFQVTGKSVNVNEGPGRPGDPAVLNGSGDKWNEQTGWQAAYNLRTIVEHAWAWYSREL
jgi:UDP-glucose 4-epimerase